MLCTHCGQKTKPGLTFCPNCGSKQEELQKTEKTKPATGKTNLAFFLGGAGLLALVVAVLGILLVGIEAEKAEGSRGIFYEVKGGENQVYLFGSVHVGHQGMYPLEAVVKEAFRESDVLGLEIDMTGRSELEIGEEILPYALNPEGALMTDIVPQELFEEIAEIVQEQGVPSSLLNQFQPWYAGMLLTVMAAEEAGLSEEYGVESYFIEKAEEREMEITALESFSLQLEPYRLLSEESQIYYLENTLEMMEEAEKHFDQLINTWKEGDVEALAELRRESMEEVETDSWRKYQVAMLDERDARMAAVIEEKLESDSDNTYFLVVGALHLTGENSIVDQLKQRGYELNPAN